MTPESANRASLLLSIAVAIFSAVIGWHSAQNLETLWDEAVDHDIAVGLARNPILGQSPTLDPSQMRLPMYVNALVTRLTGQDDLRMFRAVSLLVGAATIIGTGALARACFGPLAAALAVVILGFSPYFLAYARIAMTEGDIFFACFVTWSLYALVRYLRRPSPENWILAAVLAALAVGSKLFGGFLYLVGGVMIMASGPARSSDLAGRPEDVRRLHRLLLLAATALVLALILARYRGAWAAVAWAIAFILWITAFVHVIRRRVLAPGRITRYAGLVAFSLIACGVLMPVHVTEYRIAQEIARRILRWDNSFPLALWSDHLRLYAGIVLVKLTVPWGVLTSIALVYAAFRERDDGRWRAAILSVVFYIALICLLPLRQSFYLIGVYPLIMILTAALAVEIGRGLRRFAPALAKAWTILLAILLIHLGVQLYETHPHYHLYGYELVGDRWLGAESRGYRNLIQTPSDGVESLIRWCNTDPRVRRGDTVVSYLWEHRIIQDVLPDEPHYVLIPRGVVPESDEVPPPPSIESADYVLLHINNLLGYGDRPPDWPPPDLLTSRFEVIHTVRRGPLAVAWVYAAR